MFESVMISTPTKERASVENRASKFELEYSHGGKCSGKQ